VINVKKIASPQTLEICGITRTYKLIIDPVSHKRTFIGTTDDDTIERIGGRLQYWSAASVVAIFAKKGSFKATFSVLLPSEFAHSTKRLDDIPEQCERVILLALWLAPCGQLHSIGTVNGGPVQKLPKFNSWVTAPLIDLSSDRDSMWDKYIEWINYHGPYCKHDSSRRYVHLYIN
jgi:hypothetical protein